VFCVVVSFNEGWFVGGGRGEAYYCNNEGRKSKVRGEKGNEKEVKGHREGIH